MSGPTNLDLGPEGRWDLQLPALTIKEPWLEMIVSGWKRAEFRSWKLSPNLVGHTVILCAGKAPDRKAEQYLLHEWKGPGARFVEGAKDHLGHARALCVFGPPASPMLPSYLYTPGNPHAGWAWPIKAVIKLAHPFRVSGRQRFFKLRATYRQLYVDLPSVDTYKGLGPDHVKGFLDVVRAGCVTSGAR